MLHGSLRGVALGLAADGFGASSAGGGGPGAGLLDEEFATGGEFVQALLGGYGGGDSGLDVRGGGAAGAEFLGLRHATALQRVALGFLLFEKLDDPADHGDTDHQDEKDGAGGKVVEDLLEVHGWEWDRGGSGSGVYEGRGKAREGLAERAGLDDKLKVEECHEVGGGDG